jgi:hypothetical protein
MEETGHAHLAQASEDGTRVVGFGSAVAAVGPFGQEGRDELVVPLPRGTSRAQGWSGCPKRQ